MDIRNKVVIVTGGASGIGRALCERFSRDGARGVVVADLDDTLARQVAAGIGGMAQRVNVGDESEVQRLVNTTTERYGQVDLFCSNAGVLVRR